MGYSLVQRLVGNVPNLGVELVKDFSLLAPCTIYYPVATSPCENCARDVIADSAWDVVSSILSVPTLCIEIYSTVCGVVIEWLLLIWLGIFPCRTG